MLSCVGEGRRLPHPASNASEFERGLSFVSFAKAGTLAPPSIPTALHRKSTGTGTVPKIRPSTSRISPPQMLWSLMTTGNQPKIHSASRETGQPPDCFRPLLPPHKPNFRGTNHESLLTNHRISNSQPELLETIATHRKQTISTKSNSQLSPLLLSALFHPFLSAEPRSTLQPLASSLQTLIVRKKRPSTKHVLIDMVFAAPTPVSTPAKQE
jgi:hypothetical protein